MVDKGHSLVDFGPLAGARLLDVGCGTGHYPAAHFLSPAQLRALLLQPYGRVKMTSADGSPERSGSSPLAAIWVCLRLLGGRSVAPFIAASVRPNV